VDDTVVDLIVDMHEAVAQPGQRAHPLGKVALDGAFLLEHGEGIAKVGGGAPSGGRDHVIGHVDARLCRDLNQVASGERAITLVLGDRQLAEGGEPVAVCLEVSQHPPQPARIDHQSPRSATRAR